jgi:hypothetical protein
MRRREFIKLFGDAAAAWPSAALSDILILNWFEYVPGCRTPAGTSTGLSFASWG